MVPTQQQAPEVVETTDYLKSITTNANAGTRSSQS